MNNFSSLLYTRKSVRSPEEIKTAVKRVKFLNTQHRDWTEQRVVVTAANYTAYMITLSTINLSVIVTATRFKLHPHLCTSVALSSVIYLRTRMQLVKPVRGAVTESR